MYNRPPQKNKTLRTYLILVAILTSFTIGLFTGRSKAVTQNTARQINQVENKYTKQTDSKVDFAIFWDVWDLLQQKFIHQPLDCKKMVYGAISGMVKSLEDPYTAFLNPEESKEFLDEIEGNLEGIGAELGMKNEALTIISPLSDSPAEKAGLKPNDIILKINDEDTADMNLLEAVSKIRGKEGTQVKLTIYHDGDKDSKEVTLTRQKITIKSVEWALKSNNIAYLKLGYFGKDTASEFQNAVNQILPQNPKGIILDLRNNSGGYLDSSIDIINFFIPKGKVAAIESFSDGKKEEFKTKSNAPFENIPVVVLMNSGSASASEIVAGALRDLRQIKLIGEKSFGKGTVQQLEDLKDGSTVKISIAEWLTPNGTSINGKGLEPDINIELTEKDYNENKDPQLDKAIEELLK
ncbi:MAG: S41 family peptidase [Patescibacteria group bacterium]|nr:S41 family peptidase [Patescibacteria group bacterium]